MTPWRKDRQHELRTRYVPLGDILEPPKINLVSEVDIGEIGKVTDVPRTGGGFVSRGGGGVPDSVSSAQHA